MDIIIVSLIVIAAIVYIALKVRKQMKNEGGCNCSGCPTATSCSSAKKDEKESTEE